MFVTLRWKVDGQPAGSMDKIVGHVPIMVKVLQLQFAICNHSVYAMHSRHNTCTLSLYMYMYMCYIVCETKFTSTCTYLA